MSHQIDFSKLSNFLDRQLIPVDLRKRKRAYQGFNGKKTGLSVNQWVELIFQFNELRAMQQYLNPDVGPLSDDQIMHNFKLEFGGKQKVNKAGIMVTPGNSILSGVHTWNWKRTEYRKGTLFANQIKPFLVSFKYLGGKLVKDETRVQPKYPTFVECQEICIKFKIADPRFFTITEMERLHQYAIKEGAISEWRFPTTQELKTLGEIIPIDPYRSILTYDLHKKANPAQEKKPKTNPIEDIETRKEEIKSFEKEDLEERRRRTQKFLSSIDDETEIKVSNGRI